MKVKVKSKTWTATYRTGNQCRPRSDTAEHAVSDLGLQCLLKLQEVKDKMLSVL